MNRYEIGIIGGGPAGYHAALEAARCGMSVVLIEQKMPGGVCLFEGCIPTKSLVTSTKGYYHALKQSTIQAADLQFDWQKAKAKKEKDVKKLAAGLQMQLKQKQIPILAAEGKIVSVKDDLLTIMAGEEQICVEDVIIATGSECMPLPILGLVDAQQKGLAINSTQCLTQCEPLKKLIVIGAGVVGLELASIYANTGAEVIILEKEKDFLPGLDESVKPEYLQSLKRKGIQIHFGQDILKIDCELGVKVVTKEEQGGNAETVWEADKILLAAGRKTVLSALDEELRKLAGVEIMRGHIVTDENQMTAHPHIFACGDVADKSMLAYTAGMEGERAVRFIKARKKKLPYEQVKQDVIPYVIFSNPEAAFVGASQAQCREKQIPYAMTNCSMNYSSLFAIENERENGAFCLIFHKENRKILGCHMIGNGASEVIGTVQAYISEAKTIDEVSQMPVLHPSKLEVIKEAINLIL